MIQPPLTELVGAECEAVERFVQLLQEEGVALRDGNVDALESIIPRKAEIAGTLERIAADRNRLLAGQGYPADRAGIEKLLAVTPPGSPLHAAWIRLQDGVVQARELNRINGQMIRLRQQHNASALDTLLVASGRNSGLYGPDGQPRAIGGGRIIESA